MQKGSEGAKAPALPFAVGNPNVRLALLCLGFGSKLTGY